MPKRLKRPKKSTPLAKRSRAGKSSLAKKSKHSGPKSSKSKPRAKSSVKKAGLFSKSGLGRKLTVQSAHKVQRIKRLQEEMVRKGSQLTLNRTARVNPARSASLKQYETAVKMLYAQEFEKAKILFEKIIGANEEDKELVERARIHIKLCEQKIARKIASPRTVDEHYNLAIAFYNQSRYEETFEHLRKALKYDPACDYVFYALAAASCKTGDLETALRDLREAINLKPENRFLAQRDEDFSPLKEDSRFISMVFPDRPS